MEPAVHGAEVDERPRTQAGVGDLALLHDVTRRLERFGTSRELAMLAVQHAPGGQEVDQLGGVAVRIDQRHGLGQTFERLLPFALRSVGRREVPQQSGPLGALRLLRQSGRGFLPHAGPIAALDSGLRCESVEHAALRARERLVADEIVEAPPEACRDYLQGAKGRTHQTRFDLTDEALGELVACELRLAHTKLSASGTNPFAEGHW